MVDLGETGGGEEPGGRGERRTCGQNIIYEKRILKKRVRFTRGKIISSQDKGNFLVILYTNLA